MCVACCLSVFWWFVWAEGLRCLCGLVVHYCMILYGVCLFVLLVCVFCVRLFVWCVYDLLFAVVWFVIVLMSMCACGF